MLLRLRCLTASACVLLAWAAAAEPPNPYRTIANLVQAPPGRVLGSMSMVDVAADGTLWIAERCGENNCLGHDIIAPILHTDANGKWLGAFGAGKFAWPHGIYVDPEGNLWVADARGGQGRGHQVIKFAPDGRELLRLGVAGVAGSDNAHFDGPTDVVVGRNGDVFVSDGHEPRSNNRVLKFTRDGRFVKAWGGTGSAPGRFLVPHALALDSRGRLFVADRDNNRIQIFDQEGGFLEEWTQFGRPSGLHIAADDTLYVSDNQSNEERHPGWVRGIRVGSAKDGSVAAFIPDPDFDPKRAQETGAHGLAADAHGAIYGAEVYSQSVKKYVR
ncbi:MAG TPA: peptidyl-alpha-hydroxyglycine alpha-amidating lyase family protein [Gammaproteobacteria bacterium]|jgi:DNA-binding beta-propeller fold protein YncE|nr:peptidyl-alpha-hydroxyglycine alpha-amidating lyase family protein [Gammaproteobacteria bacterium]